MNDALEFLLFSPYSLFVIREADCCVLGVNTEFCRDTGYETQAFVGRRPEQLPIWKHERDGHLFFERLRGKAPVNGWETDLKCADGSCLPFVLSAKPRLFQGESWFLVSGEENSHRLAIEAALRHSESLYRDAQEIAHLGHWELDIRKNRLIWSDEIFRIFEIDPKEFSSSYETFLGMIHPEDRLMVDEAYRRSLNEKTRYDVTHRLLMADGRIKYVHERGQSQWDDGGEPLRSIGTVQDITPLKEAELAREKIEFQLRQSQKLEAIGTLASGIAHDFNNILFAVLGYVEISLEQIDTLNPVHHNLQKIYEAGMRARDLVAQILTFCRNTAEHKKPVQIRLIVKEVLGLIRATLPASIRIYQKLETSARVFADFVQIHQVVMNLCTNAAYAMRQDDTGLLTIELEEVDIDETLGRRFVSMAPGKYIKLVVGDTGIGMSPDVRERIFEPFFTTKGEGCGTGLGLSVVHGIVKNHGGQILVYSEPGLGTTFKLFFPIISSQAMDRAEVSLPLQRGSERIMVVDDEPMIADLMTTMLESLGYAVVRLTHSMQAMQCVEKDPRSVDLLITDMNMPHMSGVRLAEKARELRSDLPVIITTGFSEKITETLVRETGIHQILMKPIVKKDLARAVRQALDDGKN